jgi:hypothetical protein
VGNGGFIAHYDGVRWRRIESGTTLPINDIWGAVNQRTGEREIVCVASNQFINEGKRLLRVDHTGVTQLPDSGLSWALNTVWHIPERRYFIGGDGLYQSRTLGPIWRRDASFPPYYKTSVRGMGLNNIVVVGFRLFWHWNGSTWRDLHETFMPGTFSRVEIKANMLVALSGSSVVIGRRL